MAILYLESMVLDMLCSILRYFEYLHKFSKRTKKGGGVRIIAENIFRSYIMKFVFASLI